MKQEIRGGQEVTGVFLSEIAAPNLLRLMQASGLDYVIVDCEHGYFDYSQVAALAAVGNGIHFPVIVRGKGLYPEVSGRRRGRTSGSHAGDKRAGPDAGEVWEICT